MIMTYEIKPLRKVHLVKRQGVWRAYRCRNWLYYSKAVSSSPELIECQRIASEYLGDTYA